LGLADERLEKRPGEAGVGSSAALECLVEELVDSEEERRLRTSVYFRALGDFQRRFGRLPHAFALPGIAYPKELHEADRLVEAEPRGTHRECGSDLLVRRELR
jgi:hypothetical protein